MKKSHYYVLNLPERTTFHTEIFELVISPLLLYNRRDHFLFRKNFGGKDHRLLFSINS